MFDRICEDERERSTDRYFESKAALRRLLAVAVRNTVRMPVEPAPRQRDFETVTQEQELQP